MCTQGEEIELVQFADDINFTLEGSAYSFTHTINTLNLCADISGFEINFDKTNAVSRGKYSSVHRLVRNPGILAILGIKFSVEMEIMVQLNFDSQIYEFQKPLEFWCKRKLNPFGKIADKIGGSIKKCSYCSPCHLSLIHI